MIMKLWKVSKYLTKIEFGYHKERNWNFGESSGFSIISQSSENSDPSSNSNNQRAIEIKENEELKRMLREIKNEIEKKNKKN